MLAVAAGLGIALRVARGWTRPRHIAEVTILLLVILVALSFRLGDHPIVPLYSFWILGAEVVLVYWICLAKSGSPYMPSLRQRWASSPRRLQPLDRAAIRYSRQIQQIWFASFCLSALGFVIQIWPLRRPVAVIQWIWASSSIVFFGAVGLTVLAARAYYGARADHGG